MSKRVEKAIVVNVPVEEAFHEWTHFERFPEFMEGVKEVDRIDDRRLHWVAEVGNKKKEWDAEIVSLQENEEIAWKSTSGAPNEGTVRFRALSRHESEVRLVVEYEPEGMTENVASWFGGVGARIQGDLERFKEHMESRALPGREHFDPRSGIGEPRTFTDVETELETGRMTGGALPAARARGASIREESSAGAERTQPMRYQEEMPRDRTRRSAERATFRDRTGAGRTAESGTFQTDDETDVGLETRKAREAGRGH